MTNFRPTPGILFRLSVAAVLFATGIPAGWLLHVAVTRHQGAATAEPATRLIRSESGNSWQFINPLLECETAERYLQQPGLAATKVRASAYIEGRMKEGGIVHVSVYFRQLHDGPWFGINERDLYAPASLFKLPVLIAVLKRAEREPALLQRRLTFDDPDDLNRLMRYQPASTLRRGQSYTVEDLCRRMATFSDNNAQRLLTNFVGQPQIDQVLLALGILPELQLSGGDLSIKSISAFFRVLYNASVLNAEMSELALEMLSHSSFREGIQAGIPAGVPVSSKHGEAWVSADLHQLHEFAIVYHRDHPYLLGVMTRGRDFEQIKAFTRELSRIIYEDVNETRSPSELLSSAPESE